MNYKEISNYITDAAHRISNDKDRLSTIINSINTGVKKDNMNELLIANLTNIEFDHPKMDSAIEYIIIILTNLEARKAANDKGIVEELVINLRHSLDTLKSIELVFNALRTELDKYDKKISSSLHPADKLKSVNKHTDLTWLKPKGAAANTIFYITIMFMVLFGMYEYDKTSLKAISNTTVKTETILHPMGNSPFGTTKENK